MAKNSGLKITRKYTSPGDPYQGIVWEKRTSKITNPDGSIVFEMNDVEIPSTWSQVATTLWSQSISEKLAFHKLMKTES